MGEVSSRSDDGGSFSPAGGGQWSLAPAPSQGWPLLGGSPGPAGGGAPPEGGRRARGSAQPQKACQGFLAELAERERG